MSFRSGDSGTSRIEGVTTVLPRETLCTLLDIIDGCSRGRADRGADVMEKLARLGQFSAIALGLVVRDGNGEMALERYAVHGFSPRIAETYVRRRLFRSDPVLRSAFETAGASDWSGLTKALSITKARSIRRLHCADPMTGDHQILWSFKPTPGNCRLVMVAAGKVISPPLVDAVSLLLPHLAIHLERNAAGTSPAQRMSPASLTPRESEILNWLVEGKSAWEIGQILSRSERTVKFHISNLYLKLKAENRAQAVSKALSMNLLPSERSAIIM